MARVKWVWTIPNILSLVRLVLLPVFAVLYLNSIQNPALMWWSLGVLAFSGLTDLFDGYIARRFNQITEIGKLLDPVADKLTQVTVLVCLAIRMPRLVPLLVICLVKELIQIIGGWLLVSKLEVVQAAEWFGKVTTFVFYGTMLLFVFWPDMPLPLFWCLVCLVAGLMLFSLLRYTLLYFKHRRNAKK